MMNVTVYLLQLNYGALQYIVLQHKGHILHINYNIPIKNI